MLTKRPSTVEQELHKRQDRLGPTKARSVLNGEHKQADEMLRRVSQGRKVPTTLHASPSHKVHACCIRTLPPPDPWLRFQTCRCECGVCPAGVSLKMDLNEGLDELVSVLSESVEQGSDSTAEAGLGPRARTWAAGGQSSLSAKRRFKARSSLETAIKAGRRYRRRHALGSDEWQHRVSVDGALGLWQHQRFLRRWSLRSEDPGRTEGGASPRSCAPSESQEDNILLWVCVPAPTHQRQHRHKHKHKHELHYSTSIVATSTNNGSGLVLLLVLVPLPAGGSFSSPIFLLSPPSAHLSKPYLPTQSG